jgi:ribose transport system permease protein
MTATTQPTPPPAGDRLPAQSALKAGLMRASGSFRALGTLLALALIWVYFSFESQYFFTKENIWNIFLQSANVGIIAAGLTVVMIAAEIDLSIGSLEALSGSVAAVVVINHGYSIYVGIAAGLGATVLCGAISGLLTWKFKVVSFISTLAMLGIAQGTAFILTNGQAVAGFGETYDKIGTFTIRGFPGAAIIAAVVFLVLHLMLTRTRFGLRIYAVGGNAHRWTRRADLRIWSITIAAMMITPTAICCQKSGTFIRIRPSLMLAIITTPIAVPSTFPTPPKSDVPPMTTAATACSRSFAPKRPLPASSRELRMIPPMPAVRPLIISA